MANRNIWPGAGLELENVNAGRIANAVDGSVDAFFYIPVSMLDNIDIEIVTTGTLTGAFTLEMSSSRRISQGVNSAPTIIQAGTWTDITANALAKLPMVTRYGTDPAAGVSTNRFVVQWCPSQFLRIKWDQSSGAGLITIYVNGKGF